MPGPYKQYQRGVRGQQTEELFGMGMNFTNNPLKEGFLKELVNFDQKDKGASLIPRPGLRATTFIMPPEGVAYGYPVDVEGNGTAMITAVRTCVEQDIEYQQVIVGMLNPNGNSVPDTELFQGGCRVDTISPTVDARVPFEEIQTQTYKQTSLAAQVDTSYYSFRKPVKAEIHGLNIADSKYLARQVGTFAFSNSYYSFMNGVINGLSHTVLDNDEYKTEIVTPRSINPKEAVMWGYNMLSTTPYLFANSYFAGTIQLLGIMPYIGNDLVMSPQPGQNITLKCFYAVPSGNRYKVTWETKTQNEITWNSLKIEDRLFNNLNELSAPFSAIDAAVMVRVTCNKWDGAAFEEVPEAVMVVGFNFNKAAYGSTMNVKPATYNLKKASGLTYWRNRLVIYGVVEDKTLLFMSEVNDPSYFPYPNNVEVFDEPIIHATPFLDNLLVFTATRLYMITLMPDGLTWTKKLIQGNLNIREWDVHLIQTVKNMVFFRSGNYYYMVVPKLASMTGDLVIAPISKMIEGFLDNFQTNIAKTLKIMYNYTSTLNLIHYYNYLDFEDIHNVYVFETNTGVYVNVVLLYNTMSRSWRVYVYESQHILAPFKQDATQKGTQLSIVNYQNELCFQYLQFNPLNPVDYYIQNVAIDPLFKNYQWLDTGFREQQVDYKKRYREIQMEFNNISQEQLQFYTEFMIDSEIRRGLMQYTVTTIPDPLDPEQVITTVSYEYVDPLLVPANTELPLTNYWMLDPAVSPEVSLHKVQMPVSGKGFSPRFKLLSFNEKRYELLNMIWIYRLLNSR